MLLTELVAALVAADKNVLVCDTCNLLDVIRSPFRNTMYVVEFASRIDREMQSDVLPFSLVLSSLFRREWTDNVANIRNELISWLERHKRDAANLNVLHQLVQGRPLIFPDVTSLQFAEDLEEMCDRIIASASQIEEQDQCKIRAMDRVNDLRAPAQKGKLSAKDCQIFEETLELGMKLREQGFARKIVFASSNKLDYGDTSSPFPDIKADLAVIKAEFASTLNYAYHVAAS